MGEVQLLGLGPYALPVAQGATASAAGNTVVASFRVLSDPNQPDQRMETVTIQMLPNQATEFAAHLLEAASKAHEWERARNPKRS